MNLFTVFFFSLPYSFPVSLLSLLKSSSHYPFIFFFFASSTISKVFTTVLPCFLQDQSSPYPQHCRLLHSPIFVHWRSKAREEGARSQLPGADNRKVQDGTKQSTESDVGTLTLVRYPLLPSLLCEEGKAAGPLSKKALKHVLDLKTCENPLHVLVHS